MIFIFMYSATPDPKEPIRINQFHSENEQKGEAIYLFICRSAVRRRGVRIIKLMTEFDEEGGHEAAPFSGRKPN